MSARKSDVGLVDGIMTVHDVAGYLRLSEAKVYKMAKEGHVPVVRMGKSWRFRKDLIDEWMRRQTELGLRATDDDKNCSTESQNNWS